MKVLQVNCVYRNGSTGKIVYDLHTALKQRGVDSVVCYGRGAAADEPDVFKTCPEWYARCSHLRARLTGQLYGGCLLSTAHLISVIRRQQPDVVHLHCINGYFVNIPRLITWLKKHRIKTVITEHAEFLFTASCGYALDCERWNTGCGACPQRRELRILADTTHRAWKKQKKAFSGFSTATMVGVSPWLTGRSASSAILGGLPHETVLNGIDTTVFRPADTTALRSELGLNRQKILLHVTAYFSADPTHLKGGSTVLELARRLAGEDVVILVAGNYDSAIQPPSNLRFLGRIADQTRLAQFYSLADATLLTSKRETFSMPVAESLCCGTPVVGYCAGGPEGIALRAHSVFVPYGDMEALHESVTVLLRREKASEGIAEQAAAQFGAERMCAQYEARYREMMRDR